MPEERKSLFRSLGEFFGHVRHGLKADVGSRRVVRHEVEEERQGNITLRRTIIEEVEIRPADEASDEERREEPPAGG